MKRFIISMLVIFSAAYMINAHSSEEFDIATMKCNNESSEEENKDLIIWLDGYLTALAGRTESSARDIEQLGEFVETECNKDPNQNILSIFEKR